MNYYHIDKETLSIISGPHDLFSVYVKKLTCCGNPDLLDLSSYGLVPEIIPERTMQQKYEGVTVFEDRVEKIVVDKTQEEIAIDIQWYNNGQKALRQSSYQSESDPLFFDYQRGVVTKAVWEAKVAEIKERYPYMEDTNNDGAITSSDSPSMWQRFLSWFR